MILFYCQCLVSLNTCMLEINNICVIMYISCNIIRVLTLYGKLLAHVWTVQQSKRGSIYYHTKSISQLLYTYSHIDMFSSDMEANLIV
jgi:hypothetical protein